MSINSIFSIWKSIICFAIIGMSVINVQAVSNHDDDGNDALKEGYYRILSAGNGPGYSGGPYNYEYKVAWYNHGGVVYWADYDTNDYSMIFRLTPNGSDWNIFNLSDKSYIGKGTGSYGCEVATSTTPVAQTISPIGNGKYTIKATEATYMYAMRASHNGSAEEMGYLNVWGTYDEAVNFGVNVWYLQPVSEEIVEYLEQNQNKPTYSISQIAATPETGKTYAIRNASTKTYLTCNGPLTNDVYPEPEYFWQIESSGKKIDGIETYYLKSVAQDKYWKYINYAAQTWDGGSPYDAYDWYSYAGFNGEFSTTDEAMEVTVLKAGSTGTWRTNGTSSGYVLAMRDPIQADKTYYYKLGCQDNNVGMEPWDENVGWEFYPVVISGDVGNDLRNAIEAYGNINTNTTTSTDPGFYDTSKMESYKKALAYAKSLDEHSNKNVIKSAIAELKATYDAVKEPNPIREGYFYIVTAGNGSGYSGGPYNYEGKSALCNGSEYVEWENFDPNNFNQIYHFTQNSDGNWDVASALNGTYIYKGKNSYSTSITVTTTPDNSQVFEFVNEGKFTIKPNGNPYVYSVAASHNGSASESGRLNIWGTYEEACKYGVNVWYIKEVPEEVMDRFSKTDSGLMTICTGYEALANNMQAGTQPGYYIQENIDALKQTINECKQKVFESTTDEEKQQLRQRLTDAYTQAQETVAITDGYYYLINNYLEYEKNYGNLPAIYTAPQFSLSANGSACYYDTFNKNNANYIYKVEAGEQANTYSVRNAYTGWYLNTGDGNGAAGEIMTCSSEMQTPQIFKWYAVGQFWMADETDNSVGHAVANAVSLNKRDFIVGGPVFGATISKELKGYNTWSLIPLSDSEALNIIKAQQSKDQITGEAFNKMQEYNKSIEAQYNDIVNNTDYKYNADAVTMLKSKEKIVSKYISSRAYDITSSADDYKKATDELVKALENALSAKPDTTTNAQLIGTPIGAVSIDYSTSQQSTTVNTPGDVFDNDYTTYYAAYDRSTGWVGLDLGTKHVITKVAYAPRASWAKRMVLGVFEGANKPDFSDAIPFHIIKDEPQYNEMTYANIDCSRGFRYVRYVGPNDVRCNISELRFYGNRGEGDDSHLYQVTNLPLVVIRTDANISDVTSKTTWLPGHINIISEDGTVLKTDSMKVRGRGNGSWTFEKKPYKFKLENKAKLLNMPAKAREWTLINNYGDKTLFRNAVAFKLSDIFELEYTPACTLVDVIFNGQYKGSYQLCDQVEVHKNRIEVTHMDENDNAGDSLTGGYHIELDAYAGSEPKHFSSSSYGIPVTVHYPDNESITDAQFNYIKSAFNDVCDRVFSTQYKDSIQGYKPVFDEETWLKYFLIQELSGNTDAYWSVHMTKDRGGKFKTSPIWDFDLAFDNDGRTHPILTMSDYLCLSSKSSAASGVRNFNRKIVESCQKELTEMWSWYRYNGDLNYEVLKATVDSLYEENKYSADYNYTRWPTLNTRTQQQYVARGTYKAECDFMNEYLYDRLAWMDNKVGLEEPIGIHNATDDEAHGGIHGHKGCVLIRGFADGAEVRVFSINGIIVSEFTINEFDNRIELPKGIYVVKVKENNKTLSQKVVVE